MYFLLPFSISLLQYWTKVHSAIAHESQGVSRFSYRGLKRNLVFGSRTRSFGLEEKYTLEYNDALHSFRMCIPGK